MTSIWKQAPISKLCTLFTDGDWIETKDQSPSGVRLVQTGNVGKGEFKDRREKARFVSLNTFERLKCEEIYRGDCLVSRLPDPVGRSCIIPETDERMITAVDCSILRFDKKLLSAEFFNYYSQSQQYLQDIEKHCTGATRKRISRKKLGEVLVPLPPLPEQNRIVAILDEAFEGIDRAIANAEKSLANARELFQSYLRNSFTPNPAKWIRCTYQDCIITIKPPTKIPKQSFMASGEFPIISQEKSLINGRWAESADVIRVESPLLIFGDHTRVFKYVDFDFVAGADGIKIFKPKPFINAKYLYYYSLCLPLKVLGYSRHYRILKDLSIWYPQNLSEQQTLSENAMAMEADIGNLTRNYLRKIASLEDLKESLLQKAFSGELTAKQFERNAEEFVA